jgi:hypothetical protein
VKTLILNHPCNAAPKPRGRQGKGDVLANNVIAGLLQHSSPACRRHQIADLSSPAVYHNASNSHSHRNIENSPAASRMLLTCFDDAMCYPSIEDFLIKLDDRATIKLMQGQTWEALVPKFLAEGITHLNHLAAMPPDYLGEICGKKALGFLLAEATKEEMLKFHCR